MKALFVTFAVVQGSVSAFQSRPNPLTIRDLTLCPAKPPSAGSKPQACGELSSLFADPGPKSCSEANGTTTAWQKGDRVTTYNQTVVRLHYANPGPVEPQQGCNLQCGQCFQQCSPTCPAPNELLAPGQQLQRLPSGTGRYDAIFSLKSDETLPLPQRMRAVHF